MKLKDERRKGNLQKSYCAVAVAAEFEKSTLAKLWLWQLNIKIVISSKDEAFEVFRYFLKDKLELSFNYEWLYLVLCHRCGGSCCGSCGGGVCGDCGWRSA